MSKLFGASVNTVCPACGKNQHVPIENDLCIRCHDKAYTDALSREDEASRSIVREYRLTAASVLGTRHPWTWLCLSCGLRTSAPSEVPCPVCGGVMVEEER